MSRRKREEPLLSPTAGVVNESPGGETDRFIPRHETMAVYDGQDLSMGESHTEIARAQPKPEPDLSAFFERPIMTGDAI